MLKLFKLVTLDEQVPKPLFGLFWLRIQEIQGVLELITLKASKTSSLRHWFFLSMREDKDIQLDASECPLIVLVSPPESTCFKALHLSFSSSQAYNQNENFFYENFLLKGFSLCKFSSSLISYSLFIRLHSMNAYLWKESMRRAFHIV